MTEERKVTAANVEGRRSAEGLLMSRVYYFWRLEINWPLSLLDCALAAVDVIAWAIALSRIVR